MDIRFGLVVILVLAANWASDARNLVSPHLQVVENGNGNMDMCTLCEEYTTLAFEYLSQNKTQIEVMEALHNACFQMHSLKEQCIMLVDTYVPIFFLQVSSMQHENFCKVVGLCRNARMPTFSGEHDKCDLCHHAVDEVIDKLKDPDTELGVIEVLLKACDAVGNYKIKCKSLVFEFGPMILTDTEKFMEQVDLCTTFHACPKSKADTKETLEGKIEMVTSS